MVLFLQDPEADPPLWVDYVISCQEEISKMTERKASIKPLYRGELEQLHGKAEAARFIRAGKWREGRDKDGDRIYFKVQGEQTQAKRHAQSITGTRTAQLSVTTVKHTRNKQH